LVPKQIDLVSPGASDNKVELPHETSLLDVKEERSAAPDDVEVKEGIRLWRLEPALIKVPERFFRKSPTDARICLGAVRSTAPLLGRLLDGEHSVIAGRLAGAFRNIGRPDFADEIVRTMKAAGFKVSETDPFGGNPPLSTANLKRAPLTARIAELWGRHRATVLEEFTKARPEELSAADYLKNVEEIYVHDAYHSLGIEGYRVTYELIERVKSGAWSPLQNEEDRRNRDAMAARGYALAFELVRTGIGEILDGKNAVAVLRSGYGDWYRKLFEPSVQAGLLRASALAGFRDHPIYIKGSMHVPPSAASVMDGMSELLDQMEKEVEPSVRAVLGHWLFGYVHPYPDGNGRMARFVMNAMLSSGGYPWTVIRKDDKERYLAALDSASVEDDLRPFANFVSDRVQWSIESLAKGEPTEVPKVEKQGPSAPGF